MQAEASGTSGCVHTPSRQTSSVHGSPSSAHSAVVDAAAAAGGGPNAQPRASWSERSGAQIAGARVGAAPALDRNVEAGAGGAHVGGAREPVVGARVALADRRHDA